MVTAFALAVSACGGSTGSSGSTSNTNVELGVVGPQSGSDAPLGIQMSDAVQLAVKDATKQGGLPGKITVNVQDDQELPATGVEVAHKFCDTTDMIGVVGDLASTVTGNTQVVYNSCNMAQVTVSSRDDLTQKGFTNFFRTSAINSDASRLSVDYITKTLSSVHSVATVNTNDATSVTQTQEFAKDAQSAGLTVTDNIAVQPNETDYRGALTSLIAKKPDLMYLPFFYSTAGLIVKQARELGYTGVFLGGDALDDPNYVKVAGVANASGTLIASLGSDPTQTPSAAKFVSEFRSAYGSDPDVYAAQAYDAAMAIIKAWKAAGGGTDRAKVVSKLAKVNFQGTLGPIAFDSKGDLTHPLVGIFKVQSDGNITYVGPA